MKGVRIGKMRGNARTLTRMPRISKVGMDAEENAIEVTTSSFVTLWLEGSARRKMRSVNNKQG